MSWRRILLLSVLVVGVIAGVTWALLQNSDAATVVVQRELQALFKPRATIAGTNIDLGLGRLTVRDVRIDDPRRPGAALLAAKSVAVDASVADGLELVGVHGVLVDGFELAAGPTFPTADELFAPQPAATASTGKRVPPIELRGGRIVLTLRDGVAPLVIGELGVRAVPREDGAGLTIRGEGKLAELAAAIALAGEVDPGTGAATLIATVTGARLDQTTIARVCALLGTKPPVLDAAAAVQSLRATIVLPPGGATPGEPRLTAVAELRDVRVRGDGVPAIVNAATVELQASNQRGGEVIARLQQSTTNGTLDVTARATELTGEPALDVRVDGRDIAIDTEVLAALRSFRTGRDVVEALQPTAGRADLALFLGNPHRRGGLAELDLSLREVQMTFRGFGSDESRTGFPLPLTGASGRVRLRDDVVLLEDVHATIAGATGGGTVRMHGRVDGNRPAGEDASLDIRADGVAFSNDLREALTSLLDDGGSLYDRFAPAGRATVEVQVRPRSELPDGWSVEVRPDGSSMQWAGFPYRLDDLRGSVRASDDGVTFDLTGRHGKGTLGMRGFIPLGAGGGDESGFVATVELQQLVIDDDLRAAVAVMEPDLDAPWRASELRGELSGRVKVWRPRPEDPLYHDARLELRGVDLALPAAPWRATQLQGQVLVQGLDRSSRVDFDALRGQLEHGSDTPAKLAMLGTLVLGEGAREDLAFVVRDLELDAQLGRTLEELQALGPGTWSSLQPSGRVDLVCRHRRQGTVAEPLHLIVQLLDVRSAAPILPRPAEHMTGELQIAGGELRFSDVRAMLGDAQVSCTAGRVRTRPAPDLRTELSFTVDASGVAVDDGIANLFTGPLRAAVLQRKLQGRADLDSLRLQFAIPSTNSTMPFETTLAGQLRLYDLDMLLGSGPDGILVRGINGVASLAESRVSDSGGSLRGAMHNVSLRLFGHNLERIEAGFVADAERLEMHSMTSSFHGGSVRSARPDAPALRYLLPGPATPEGQLQANLTFELVDAYSFLDQSGWTNPPYRGAASGEFSLERMDGNSVIGAAGNGTLRIERGDLGVVPLFTAIYAQLPASDRPRFDSLDLTWRVKDQRVEFERFDVNSSILGARGKGRFGFDGYVDLEMTLTRLLGDSADPLVMPLLDYLAQNIVTFHLFGYLRDLHAEKRWVTERKPGRREIPPMPPARPRPAAPAF